ncbi:MAG: SDR family NAD(P)-dependent oxidoreductase, partial [Abditibacteriales bacterium]|nr:SDR family NAD(P)-dependent oxidoreductase [Abditibacteriales bacterium]
MFELTDKVMIVTGAGRGIGKSIALKAAQAGADLSIGSRTMSALEEVAEVVRSMGRRCECFPLDVTKVDSINA